jgi:hypothetical protein
MDRKGVGEKEDIKRRKERQIKAGKGEYWQVEKIEERGRKPKKMKK